MTSKKPYTGLTRKLVVGIDIGTTYSGISYTLLVPGQIPEIKGVTRFPAQEHVGGDTKIPSVLIYDELGVARAMGAEAMQERIIEQAEDEGWTRLEWFKLYLRPKGLDTSHMKTLLLPPAKSIISVYADFLKYLHSCTRTYIEQTHAGGQSVWDSVKNDVEYVLTHPNGWEGTQQAYLRRAAVEAGLIHNTPSGQKRLQFLTEGEASLHFCAQNGLGDDIMSTGHGVVIVDAGGGTIDLSAFTASSEDKYEEISAAQCHFQGSVFVTSRARTYLEDKFAGTRFADDVPFMATVFDRTTKLRFRSADGPAYIKFGGLRDKDPALNIRAGQLALEGADIAKFFSPSIDAMIEAVLTQYKNSHKPISHVFLVGGFAASDFVFDTLQDALKPLDIVVNRPDAHVNKAVAEGAVLFYLNRLISVHVTRFDYGIVCSVDYDQETMVSRKPYYDSKGDPKVAGHFSVIVPRNTQAPETQSFSYKLQQRSASAAALAKLKCSVSIQSYYGNITPCPEWVDMDPDKFRTHCQITGDLSSVPKPALGPKNKTYYEIRYDVNITFGPGGEMSAFLSWKDQGEEKRGPAEVIYDTDKDQGGA